MIRSSKIRSAVRLLALFAVVAGTFGLGSQEAFAQKGKSSVPAGKIYHKFHPNLVASMNSDGSGLEFSLPPAAMNDLGSGAYVVPSSRLYGGTNKPNSGSRWFVTLATTGYYDTVSYDNGDITTNWPHKDLVAVRMRPGSTTQIDVIQLTDFYGIFHVFPGTAFLSNDSNEDPATSFVGAGVRDIRDTFVVNPDGTTTYNVSLSPTYTLRLPLTVSEFLAPGFQPFDETLTDEEIDDLLWPYLSNRQASTSPAGDLAVETSQSRLVIVDAAAPDYDNPVRLLWDGTATSPVTPSHSQWSPNGLTIAFSADSSSNVWTVPVTGGAPKKILSGTATSKYYRPIWSPDSQYVVAVRDDYEGATVAHRYLVRVPAGGGTVVTLREIGTTGGPALRWVPNN